MLRYKLLPTRNQQCFYENKKKEMRGILMFLPKKNTIQIVISYTGLATITVSVSNKKKIT
jgi:hypothetical protein